MARYTRTPVSTLQGINNELAKVELAMEDTLDRKGVTPNYMDANLDMNSRRILNLPTPLTDQEPLRRGDVPTGLSVSAQYVDSAVNEAVQGLTSDYTLRVQNIEALKSLTISTSEVGEYRRVSEYHEGTGYGGGEWKVVTGETANDIDIIQSSYDASVQFKYILIAGTSSNEVNPCCIGAKASPSFDNAAIIERAASLIKGGILTFDNNGKYEFSRTVYLPAGVSIKGNTGNRSYSTNFDDTVQLASQVGGVYGEGFLFFLNIDPNGNTETWVTPFPNIASGSVSDISVDGSATNGINGFKFAGSYEFENIDCRYVGTLIRKPSSLYTDKIKAKRLHGRERANTTDFLVDLPGSGDSPEIENIESGIVQGASFPAPEEGTTMGLRLGPARGAFISGLINGNHAFQQGKYDVSNLHLEHGSIEVLNGDITIRDSDIFNEADKPVPIKLISQSEGGFGQRFKLSLSNVQFSSRVQSSLGGWPLSFKADLQTNANFDIEIEKCSRRVSTTNNQIVSQQYMGILLQDENEAPLNTFNNYSHFLSKSCRINSNVVDISGRVLDILQSFGGVSASLATETSAETFQGATGTYYYQAAIITDNQRRLGKAASNAESSVSVVNGETISKLNVVWSGIDYRSGRLLRVYRGTSTGAYDKYIDIPIYSCQTLYDNGLSLNGFAWLDRTAGAVDSFNSGSHGVAVYEDNNLAVKQTSKVIPTSGFWQQGDEVTILNPTPPTTGVLQPYRFIRLTSGNGHVSGTDWMPVNNSSD